MACHAKRPKFDAEGPFTTRSAFVFNGVRTALGKPFPHQNVKVRRLRQLYDSRRIDLAPVVEPVEPVEHEDWRQLDEQGILAYAFKVTGVRRRSVAKAIKELTDLEQNNGGAARGQNS